LLEHTTLHVLEPGRVEAMWSFLISDEFEERDRHRLATKLD